MTTSLTFLLLRLAGILDRDLIADVAERLHVDLNVALVELEVVTAGTACSHSLETFSIAALVPLEKLIKLRLVVLDLPVILEKGRVGIGLRWVVDVAKVVKVLATGLFDELDLLGRVHVCITRQVARRLRLHLVHGGRVASLRAVVNDALLADRAL